MKRLTLTAAVALVATVAFGDASIQQKAQVHFGGAMGGIINVFGRKATHEGLVTTTAVRGDRKSTRSGDNGEIIDLGEEKVYHIDYAHKTYRVVTFDEMRRQYEGAKGRSEESADRGSKREKPEGPEYEVEFNVTSTGNHAEINGWPTHEEIVTVTVHEKGKRIEKAGGYILTADLWIGPRVAALKELADFDLRFMRKLYGEAFDTDLRQMTAMMATTPAFGKAMKAFSEKQSHLEGTAIRSKMDFESVIGTEEKEGDQPTSAASALGGLMGRMRRHHDDGPQRNNMFESNSEVLQASNRATADEVAIPAGFQQR